MSPHINNESNFTVNVCRLTVASLLSNKFKPCQQDEIETAAQSGNPFLKMSKGLDPQSGFKGLFQSMTFQEYNAWLVFFTTLSVEYWTYNKIMRCILFHSGCLINWTLL